MNVVMRMLTPEAALTRFDFEWTVIRTRWPLADIIHGERALIAALQIALSEHGILSEGMEYVR